jgi:SAM-dependent methyltransferase
MRASVTGGSCPICGGTAWRDWGTRGDYGFIRCAGCALVVTDPLPAGEQLQALYADQGYYAGAARFPERNLRDARRRLALVERFYRAGRLLEVGPGRGEFARVALAAGWTVTAIESAPALAARLHGIPGLRIVACPIESAGIVDVFDAVVAWEVVEHSLDAAGFLDALAARVRPGGLLALSTPNMAGWLARALGVRHPMVTPPEHLHYFQPRTVRHWAQRHGFSVRRRSSSSNLGARELRRGFYRYLLGIEAAGAPSTLTRLALSPLVVASGVADRLGLGTQLECVLERTAA